VERAIRFYVDRTIEVPGAAAFLVQCWALASQKPLVRDLLVRRGERTVTVASLIGRAGVETGELAADLDVEAMARGLTALLDGLILQRVEEGDAYRRAAMERRVMAFLDLVAPRRPPRPAGSSISPVTRSGRPWSTDTAGGQGTARTARSRRRTLRVRRA
jgi:hypothetical protein